MPTRPDQTVRVVHAVIGRVCRYKLGRFLFAPRGHCVVHIGPLDATSKHYWEQYLRLPSGAARMPGAGTYLSVAVGRERIVGHVSIHRQWEKTDLSIPGWWLTGLEVNPLWRGRGIGKRLVESTIEQWEADNAQETLHLVVKATNNPAVSLFKGMGFVIHACPESERELRKAYRETRKGQWAYQIMKRPPGLG